MTQKVTYILFLFSTIIAYGQVTLVISDVKNPKVNQRFNLTVLLEISGENMEQETPLRMPDLSKFEIIGSASEQNTVVVDSKKGDVMNQMVYQWVLTPKEAGKIKFGSVLVTVNGKIYKTEPFEINVKENEKNSSTAENSNSSKEVYLSLELQNKTVYKNEPSVAVLRAYSREYGNFRKVSNIHFSPQKNASIKPINFTKSEIETKAGMASQIIGKFMIFPNESGYIDINPVTAMVSNSSKPQKISSNRAHLTVKKLPAEIPENYKNAVGKFDINVVNSKPNEVSEIEKPVNISIRISGAGNFDSFTLPQIVNSPDYTVYTPQITSNTVPGNQGLSGDIVADYVVIPNKAGLVTINLENFSFFDPLLKQYVNLGAKSLLLDVKTPTEIADSKSTLEKVNDYTNTVLETVNTPVLSTHSLKIKNKDKIDWRIVVGNLGLVAAVFSLVLFYRKKTSKEKLRPKLTVGAVTSIAETEEYIRKNKSHQFEENIEYLKKLKNNKDFEKFFSAYEEFKSEVKLYFDIESESVFRRFIEETKGPQIAAQYRALTEKIQIEKFSPFHSEEEIDNIFHAVFKLYGEIIK